MVMFFATGCRKDLHDRCEYYNGGNSTIGIINDHEWIDLNLPSGTLWATCNVGANKPEAYGDYFAWGEIETKSVYNWDTYAYYSDSFLTKYTGLDGLKTLQSSDDVATQEWGSGWRMPTKEQWVELYNNTAHEWTTLNGVNGRMFMSCNGGKLFFPAAGDYWAGDFNNAGSYGYYWSASLYKDVDNGLAGHIGSYLGNCGLSNYYRFLGFSVRPVVYSPQQ